MLDRKARADGKQLCEMIEEKTIKEGMEKHRSESEIS